MAIPRATHPRRAELLGTTIRRLLRRGGARAKVSRMLGKVRPEDAALMLRDFTPAEQLAVFRILLADYPDAATETLVQLEPQQQQRLYTELSPQRIADLLERAAVDDAVHILETLPDEKKDEVLAIVDLDEQLSEVQAHYAYDEDSAGRVMDTDFLALEESTTVAEAVAKVRGFAHGEGFLSYLYVTDDAGQLKGVASLRQLLLAHPSDSLRGVMSTSAVRAHVSTDQEEVAQLAARYDLLAIPVTDDENRLVGVVTVDDILDIFKEEATEDFYKLAGTTDEELLYQDRSFKVAGIRLPWLLVNLGGLLVAAMMTAHFEETFRIALLVGFIPVIMGTAGNIGSQTSTIAVRGLATGRINIVAGRIRRFLWQQIKVGWVLAATCAALAALASYLFPGGTLRFSAVVAASLFVSVMLASLNGVLIPVVFQRFGFDPAVVSGPLVTTLNDVLGILIYLGLASVLLQTVTA